MKFNTKTIHAGLKPDSATELVYTSSSLNPLSEIRHLNDGNMYISGYDDSYLRVIINPEGNYTMTNKTVFPNTSYGLTHYMPMQEVVIAAPPGSEAHLYTRTLNDKVYELSDHLGNVRAVVSDEKYAALTAGVPGDFEPAVVAGNNYYPFGMRLCRVGISMRIVTGTAFKIRKWTTKLKALQTL